MRLRTAVRTLGKKLVFSTVTPIVVPIAKYLLDVDAYNIERWRQRQALAETGRFVDANMSSVQSLPDPFSLLKYAISQLDAPIDNGLICEFGVCSGTSINLIARTLPHCTVWGFDSFEGLPEYWRDRFPKGTFAVRKPPRVRRNVNLVKGLFSDTLAPFLQQRSGPALFLHIDCDLYSSTRTVLEAFESRIGPGTVMVFDEFFNYPGWKEGEYRAFAEFVEKTDLKFEYLGYCRYGMQAALKVVEKRSGS